MKKKDITSLVKLSAKGGDIGMEAMTALMQLGPDIIEPLVKMLKDHKDENRFLVPVTLGLLSKTYGVDVLDPLVMALKDSDDIVACAAISELGKIKDARAVKPLLAALKEDKEKKWQLRLEAEEAIKMIQKAN